MSLSHFDERSGIVDVETPWGRWWQTIEEVFVEVNIPPGTSGKDCKVVIQSKHIECFVKDKLIFGGNLFETVHVNECTWTVEEKQKILIMLVKAEKIQERNIWVSLLENQYIADPLTQTTILKKLDLERFQIEHPGFDFSGADLSKCYPEPPSI